MPEVHISSPDSEKSNKELKFCPYQFAKKTPFSTTMIWFAKYKLEPKEPDLAVICKGTTTC